MAMQTVYYHLSSYVSHRVAGEAYLGAMRQAGIPLVDRPEAATTVILHDDPLNYARILADTPCLREKRRIAYSVWETEELPEQYVAPLQLVDAIWTCSPFARTAFAKHFAEVSVVPHIVAPFPVWEQDRESVKRRIGYSKDAYYFYTIVDSINPRKNLFGLIDVFLKNFLNDSDVYLVVKQYRHAYDLGNLRNVISVTDTLSYGEMFALHELCHCCLSLHHAEAWGLSLSEALCLGNPVIATGYSGNMTFMDAANSHPVGYTLEPVSEAMCRCIPLYTPAMRWARPDPGHCGYLMRKVRRQGEDAARRQAVMASMRPFGPAPVGRLLAELLG
jgi:glycosyltransferase involved in cell wall biosynthesis